jgi:hypothetical protein
MARRVLHYFDGIREDGVSTTLCRKVMTRLYRVTDNSEQVTCTRCHSRLRRMGLNVSALESPVGRAPRQAPEERDESGQTDEHHNAWLERLGVG